MDSSKTPLGSGTNSVYIGEDADGVIRYVGITERTPSLRFYEHQKSNSDRANLHYNKARTLVDQVRNSQ